MKVPEKLIKKNKEEERIKERHVLMASRLAAGKEQSTFTSTFSRHTDKENEDRL